MWPDVTDKLTENEFIDVNSLRKTLEVTEDKIESILNNNKAKDSKI